MTPSHNHSQPLVPVLLLGAVDAANADITSLSFDDDGEYLLTASEKGRELRVWSCEDGAVKRKIYVKKNGVGVARFAHRHTGIVHTATINDDHIRYLSTHDNKYIRSFQGHLKKVTCLEVSPVNDQFLSSAPGDSARLWDLRTPNCQGLLDVKAGQTPYFGWDPSGLVFGMALQFGESGPTDLRLYDARNYQKGPFSTWYLGDDLPPIRGLAFSPDSRKILIHTVVESHLILDAYNGNRLGKTQGPGRMSFQACWHPSSEQVFAGSGRGGVSIYDIRGLHTGRLMSKAIGVTSGIAFNPKKWMMVSSHGHEVVLWRKEEEKDDASDANKASSGIQDMDMSV